MVWCIENSDISAVVIRRYINLLIHPTGTECIWSYNRLTLSNVITKTSSDKVGQLRDTSIKAKSARGAMALGVGTVVERALRFVRYMILTRILAPDQFGLMAIVMVGGRCCCSSG